MTNLLAETKRDLELAGKKIEDINWIGSKDGRYAIDWNHFVKIADKEYDSGYGSQEVAEDLVIVFNDGGYLERSEYDGAEQWVYHSTPRKSDNAKSFDKVFVFDSGKEGYESIHILNNEEEE